MTRPGLYGSIMAMSGPPPDPEKCEAFLRAAAVEQLAEQHVRLVGEIEIFCLRDVSELDWAMITRYSRAVWQPGAEVWGWKAKAKKIDA